MYGFSRVIFINYVVFFISRVRKLSSDIDLESFSGQRTSYANLKTYKNLFLGMMKTITNF